MDSATILLIIASAIIIILQIVSIILILTGRKAAAKPAPAAVSPANNDTRDLGKRRDDNRFNKRPMMDQRQKPFVRPEPQPVDHIETSLRDINLKLKNAERDQENARKNMRDVVAPPQNSQRRPDNSRPNRGRDDDFRRRDRNNRPQGGQFRDRNRGPEADRSRGPEADRPRSDQPMPYAANPPASAPAPAAPVSPVREPMQNPPPSIAVSQPVVQKEPLAIVPENTEVLHGRKVLVRRRILTPEEQAAAGQPQTANPAPASQPAIGAVAATTPRADAVAPPAAGNADSANESEAQEIHFGR